jgi:hypothetical protein
MKKLNQSPPDLCRKHSTQEGFAHLLVVVALATVALGSGLVGYKALKERSLSSVEGVSISQTNVRYMTLEGKFVESNGSTPMVGIAVNGGIMKPKVEIQFKNGTTVVDTKVFEGKADGTFTTSGLTVPAGAKTFTITPKVFRVKAQDLGVLTGACSSPTAYTNCDVLKASSTDRTKKLTNVNFVSTLNYVSPTASVKFADAAAAPKAIKPGDKFKLQVTAKAQEFVPLKDVKIMMTYSYYTAEEFTCAEFNVPAVVVQGPVLTPVKGVVSQTVEITAPPFPTSATHTYAEPKFLTVYPVVTTKALAGRGSRFCSGDALNTGIPCKSCTGTATEVAKCQRMLSIWKGCGTSYVDFGQGMVTGTESSVKGAQVFVPVASSGNQTNPNLGKIEVTAQRIGGGAAPIIHITAKGKTVGADVPITDTAQPTGVISSVPVDTRLDDIKIYFANADENYEVNQRALRVTQLKLHGVTYYVDDPRVYSEGTDAVLCGHGFQRGNVLYCKGSFFQFSSVYPRNVELMMQGTPSNNVYPMVRLVAGNKTWAQFSTNGTLRKYTALVPAWFTVPEIRVIYDNDAINATGDRNLRVDYMKVNTQVYQTESPGVKSVGTWDSTTKACVREPGAYMKSEWLACNGWLQYQ